MCPNRRYLGDAWTAAATGEVATVSAPADIHEGAEMGADIPRWSVKSGKAREVLPLQEGDGALIGGASLQPEDVEEIIWAAPE